MTAEQVPADYRIAVPDSWFCVPLEPGERERAIKALADRQFAGPDHTPKLKRELREQLQRHAEAAYQAGGIELYMSMMRVGPVAVPASLLITLVPPPPSGPVSTEALAATLPGQPEQATFPAGPAVRVISQAPGTGLNVDVYHQVPGGGGWLRLAFATPLGDLADSMSELFDAIASTLRWR